MEEFKLPIDDDLPDAEMGEPQIHEPSDEESRPDIPSELNILPLRDSVIYPMLIAPLSVSREAGVQLIDDSIVGNNRVIGVIAQKQPQDENPGFDDVYEYGCAVIIRTLVKMPDAVRLIVQGVARIVQLAEARAGGAVGGVAAALQIGFERLRWKRRRKRGRPSA